MLLEVLVRWTQLHFEGGGKSAEDAYYDKIINGESESPSIPQASISYDYTKMVFDTSDVKRWNQQTDPELTTIRFADGDSFTIKVPYEYFCELMSDSLDRTITTVGDAVSRDEDGEKEDDLEL